jgi:hypothetical protein
MPHRGDNTGIVGGDDDARHRAGPFSPAIHVFDHRTAVGVGEWLAREAGGGESSGDDGDDLLGRTEATLCQPTRVHDDHSIIARACYDPREKKTMNWQRRRRRDGRAARQLCGRPLRSVRPRRRGDQASEQPSIVGNRPNDGCLREHLVADRDTSGRNLFEFRRTDTVPPHRSCFLRSSTAAIIARANSAAHDLDWAGRREGTDGPVHGIILARGDLRRTRR